MKYHLGAFALGFVLDLLLGDPQWLFHPIRLIGGVISRLEGIWNQASFSDEKRKRRGTIMAALVLLLTGSVSALLLLGAYAIPPYAGLAVESIMTYQILAVKSLRVESMKVFRRLQQGDLSGARNAAAMIVGRDTQKLDEEGVIKAAVETVAENTSDGVIAPMLALAAGGPVLGFLYKAVNTMDSMVGYRNERYRMFGRTAAKLDDAVNYLPARLAAFFMILSSILLSALPLYDKEGRRRYSGRQAIAVYRRDRKKHASPNSAQTEAVCAGSLRIRLAGPASYFGKPVSKPYIGDAKRPITCDAIRFANQLMYVTAVLCWLFCLGLLFAAAAARNVV